jgi:hypothetical protein
VALVESLAAERAVTVSEFVRQSLGAAVDASSYIVARCATRHAATSKAP